MPRLGCSEEQLGSGLRSLVQARALPSVRASDQYTRDEDSSIALRVAIVSGEHMGLLNVDPGQPSPVAKGEVVGLSYTAAVETGIRTSVFTRTICVWLRRRWTWCPRPAPHDITGLVDGEGWRRLWWALQVHTVWANRPGE